MLVKKFLGKEVISSHGDKVGRVHDVDMDIVAGRVKGVVVRSGLNTKYKLKLDDIVTVGDTVIIRYSEEDLKKLQKK